MNLYNEYTGVIELKFEDFNIIYDKKKIKNILINKKEFLNKPGFLLHYSPYCDHCKSMVDMWSNLAIEYRNRFVISAINCDNLENYKICSALSIKKYPTIKYISKSGNIYDYKGKYDMDSLIEFICYRI